MMLSKNIVNKMWENLQAKALAIFPNFIDNHSQKNNTFEITI